MSVTKIKPPPSVEAGLKAQQAENFIDDASNQLMRSGIGSEVVVEAAWNQ